MTAQAGRVRPRTGVLMRGGTPAHERLVAADTADQIARVAASCLPDPRADVPTMASVAERFARVPAVARAAAAELLRNVDIVRADGSYSDDELDGGFYASTDSTGWRLYGVGLPAGEAAQLNFGGDVMEVEPLRRLHPVEDVHRGWRAACEEAMVRGARNYPDHPLLPILAKLPYDARLEERLRPTLMLPAPLADVQVFGGTGDDRLVPIPDHVEELPKLVGNRPLVSSLGIEVDATGGGGVKLWQGAAIAFQMAAMRRDRRWGWLRVPMTLRWFNELAGGWTKFRRGRHVPVIRDALQQAEQWRIRIGNFDSRLIRCDDLPTLSTGMDEAFSVYVRMLDGGRTGALIDSRPMANWRRTDAVSYRVHLRLAPFFNRYATSRHGRIVGKRPVVRRDFEGRPLDYKGRVIVSKGKPVHWSHHRAVPLDSDGEPTLLYDADGNVVGETGKPTAEEMNDPGVLRRLPVFTPTDLAALGFDAQKVPAGAMRRRVQQVRKKLADMEAQGRIVIEKNVTDKLGRTGWRISEGRKARAKE